MHTTHRPMKEEKKKKKTNYMPDLLIVKSVNLSGRMLKLQRAPIHQKKKKKLKEERMKSLIDRQVEREKHSQAGER